MKHLLIALTLFASHVDAAPETHRKVQTTAGPVLQVGIFVDSPATGAKVKSPVKLSVGLRTIAAEGAKESKNAPEAIPIEGYFAGHIYLVKPGTRTIIHPHERVSVKFEPKSRTREVKLSPGYYMFSPSYSEGSLTVFDEPVFEVKP